MRVGPKKTALVLAGPDPLSEAEYAQDPLLLRGRTGGTQLPVRLVSGKRWLGISPWRADLSLSLHLDGGLAAGDRAMAGLAALVDAGALPLPLALACSEAKVDALLQHGRWLLILVVDAEAKLDRAYEHWGRTLLRASTWHGSTLVRAGLRRIRD